MTGLLVLFWPGASVVVIAWLFAIQLIVSGILQLVAAFMDDSGTGTGAHVSESSAVRSARSPLTAGSIARIQLMSHAHNTVLTSRASWRVKKSRQRQRCTVISKRSDFGRTIPSEYTHTKRKSS